MRQLKVRQVRSVIGISETQRRTIKGLGLGRINKEVIKPDTMVIRGMITKIQHLVQVEVKNT